MAIPYEKIVSEDLQLGHGLVPVTMPAGGFGYGNKVGIHTFGPWFNVADFGAIEDGVSDDSSAILAAIAAAVAAGGGTVLLGPHPYFTGTTEIVVSDHVSLVGCGSPTIVTYNGTGSAIRLAGVQFSTVGHFIVITPNNAANAIEAGNATRQVLLINFNGVGNQSASNTGAGILLNAEGGFSGGLSIKNCNVSGYKFGLKFICADPANFWTTVDISGLWVSGVAGAVVAGSAGLYMDANTHAGGTKWRGGTIESFDKGIWHIGGFGCDVECAMEGSNTIYQVGATFNGRIVQAWGAQKFEQWTNGAANYWMIEKLDVGELTSETYYAKRHVLYDGAGAALEEVWYRGASLVNGGSPTRKFGIGMGSAADTSSKNNFVRVLNNRHSFGDLAPADGTWVAGDVVFNNIHTRGTADDFVVASMCISGGTPGTWVRVPYVIDFDQVINPGLIPVGTGYYTNVTIAGWGFTVGSFIQVSPPYDLVGCIVTCFFKSATVAQLTIYNVDANPSITLGSGTWHFRASR